MNEKEIWEKFYERPVDKVPWQAVQSDFFKQLVDSGEVKGETALDLGCGTGMKSLYLAKHGFDNVVGVDISDRAIKIARQNAKDSDKCEFFAHDVCDLSFLGRRKFDFILDWANLHGIPMESTDIYVKQINEHSRIGTVFLLRVFGNKGWNEDYFTEPSGLKMRLFSKEEILKIFNNFEILRENQSETTIWSLNKHVFFIEILMIRVR